MSEGKIIYDEAARFDDGSLVRPRSGMMKVSSTGRAGGSRLAAGLPVLPRPRRVVLPMSDDRRLDNYYASGRESLTPAQCRRFDHKSRHQLALEGKPFGEQRHRRPEGVSSGNVTTWRAPTPGGGTLKWGEKATKGLDRIASMRPFARRGR